MKTLPIAAFRKAEEFLRSQARPLEQALFAVFAHAARPTWALEELAAFQNSDGGFGHGLEPDLQLPASSILATTVALQHLRMLQVTADHPLVVGAMRYLLDTYNSTAQAWPFIPPQVSDFPRAPWWQYSSDLSQYLANPRAEIVGFLFDYPQLSTAELRQTLLTSTIDYLVNLTGPLKMHELLCYGRLAETANLPQSARDQLLALMQPSINSVVAIDPAAWDGYVLKPLGLAPTPNSLFAPGFQDSIGRNLDFEISQQGHDGSWTPAWTWGDAYPEAWLQAKRAWQGVLTVNTVRTLAAYGRLEEA